MMRIAIDADTNGAELKRVLLEHFATQGAGVEAEDLAYGAAHPGADYPDIALNLALAVREGRYERGILICGTGLGMAICANKVQGIYAGACHDVYMAERLARSNDAQVLTLGAYVIGARSALAVVDAWLASRFEGGGSAPKVARMRRLEQESFEGHPQFGQEVTQHATHPE